MDYTGCLALNALASLTGVTYIDCWMLYSPPGVLPLALVAEVPDKVVQRRDEPLNARAVAPHEPVAVNVALGVARKLASASSVGRVKHSAYVGVVVHGVGVVFRPAAHEHVVRAGAFYQAFRHGGNGRQEGVQGHKRQHLNDLHGEAGVSCSPVYWYRYVSHDDAEQARNKRDMIKFTAKNDGSNNNRKMRGKHVALPVDCFCDFSRSSLDNRIFVLI